MHDLMHEYLLEEMGDAGMLAVRKISWKCMARFNELEALGQTDSAEYRRLKLFTEKMPLRNYFMNKGWRDAIEDFAAAILEGRDFTGAKAFDGLQAARITEAVIKSRDSSMPVIL